MSSTSKTWGGASGHRTKKERNEAESCEWDLRLTLCVPNEHKDTVMQHNLNAIKDHVQSQLYDHESRIRIKMVWISNIELGDRGDKRRKTTKETIDRYHVHCALIVEQPCTRVEALSVFVKLPWPYGKYCTERNTDYTYAGWYLHHAKPDTKVGPVGMLFEYGTCPTDEPTLDNLKRTVALAKKWGTAHQLKTNRQMLEMLRHEQKQPPTTEQIEIRKTAKRKAQEVYNSKPDNQEKRKERNRLRKLESIATLYTEWTQARNANNHLESDRIELIFISMRNQEDKNAFDNFKKMYIPKSD